MVFFIPSSMLVLVAASLDSLGARLTGRWLALISVAVESVNEVGLIGFFGVYLALFVPTVAFHWLAWSAIRRAQIRSTAYRQPSPDLEELRSRSDDPNITRS